MPDPSYITGRPVAGPHVGDPRYPQRDRGSSRSPQAPLGADPLPKPRASTLAAAQYAVGDWVAWTMKSKWGPVDRLGQIVFIIDNSLSPNNVKARCFPDHSRRFKGDKLPPGSKIAYLIEVKPGDDKPTANMRLYMPDPRLLQIVQRVTRNVS